MAWIDHKMAYDMVSHRWILRCFETYKIPDQVVQFIEKTMKTWRVELTTGGKSFEKIKIQCGISQGDALSLLLFMITMMSLNHIIRKCTSRYKLSKSQEKINHLMYMDYNKLLDINEKELETLIQTVRIYCQDIKNRIWNRKMRRASNE